MQRKLSYKYRERALAALATYSPLGVIYQYSVSKRWGWATMGSGVDEDLRHGGNTINPKAAKVYHVAVTNVEYIS